METTASRTRINLVGALELGKISKPIIKDCTTINGGNVVKFMGLIRKESKMLGEIHLILDGVGYHFSDIFIATASGSHE